MLGKCRVLERLSLLGLGFGATFSRRVSSGIRKEFGMEDRVIGEVGDKRPSPLRMLYPLDVGWLLRNGRSGCLLGRSRESFLRSRKSFRHVVHTVVQGTKLGDEIEERS